jgi:hypothetical protein
MKKVLVLLATALAIAGYVTLIIGPEVTMTTPPDQVVACHGGTAENCWRLFAGFRACCR